jgi:hypothetical protein
MEFQSTGAQLKPLKKLLLQVMLSIIKELLYHMVITNN